MKKIIKKLSMLVFSVLMATAMVPTAGIAAEGNSEERIAVYVDIPDDWTEPCIWAWDEDGNNAFEAWPGGSMDADSANEGWYYTWIPSWATHVIINANDGSVQTGEQILEGKNTWITITDAETVDISYDKKTTGDIPEYVKKFTVHAKVDESWSNPCIWAWLAPDGTNAFEAWPGEAMKANDSGWYSKEVPIWINSVIINANEAGVQTEDITIDPAEVWITVDKDGVADFSYNDPDKAAVENITVSVKVPDDWSSPCIWAWLAPDGTNVFTTWPGEALDEGDGWYTKELPGWINSVIINAGEGSVQTSDITVEVGKNIWVVVNGPEDYSVTYEEPAADDTSNTTTAAETKAEATTAAEKETDENDSKINPLIVAGIAAGVVIVAAVIVIVVKKNKK